MVKETSVGAWYAFLWWIGGLLAILLLIHLLASFMESKGWIYYRKSGPGGTRQVTTDAVGDD